MNSMKYFKVLLFILLPMWLTSCATVIGGSRYNAEVIVEGHPHAEIRYYGRPIGYGKAYIEIERRDADRVYFTVKENGEEAQDFVFSGRKFRGWAFVHSLLWFTGYYKAPGVFLLNPWGVALDGMTGSWWKPDDSEPGIVKVNYDNYRYFLNYRTSNKKPEETPKKEGDTTGTPGEIEMKLKQIEALRDNNRISEETYQKMRDDILYGQ